jgi:hypothetical protein
MKIVLATLVLVSFMACGLSRKATQVNQCTLPPPPSEVAHAEAAKNLHTLRTMLLELQRLSAVGTQADDTADRKIGLLKEQISAHLALPVPSFPTETERDAYVKYKLLCLECFNQISRN